MDGESADEGELALIFKDNFHCKHAFRNTKEKKF